MNSALTFVGVVGVLTVLSSYRQNLAAAQPLCADGDPLTSKLCLTVLEELLRRNHQGLESEFEPPLRSRLNPELFENSLPLIDRGTKRQDVDHVFLRFGR